MAIATEPTQSEFEAYEAMVYAWAFRILGHHHDALDVVQDVFLRWNRQCETENLTQPRGWLRRVTVHRAIDLRRRSRRTGPLMLDADEAVGSDENASDRIDDSLVRERLLRAMDKLSEMQRLVLIAKTFDALTFADIARDMQSSVSTVKTHYVRALRTLRDALGLSIESEVRP